MRQIMLLKVLTAADFGGASLARPGAIYPEAPSCYCDEHGEPTPASPEERSFNVGVHQPDK